MEDKLTKFLTKHDPLTNSEIKLVGSIGTFIGGIAWVVYCIVQAISGNIMFIFLAIVSSFAGLIMYSQFVESYQTYVNLKAILKEEKKWQE